MSTFADRVNQFRVTGHSAALVLLLAGCESDAEELRRLENERVISCLAAQGEERAGNYNSEYRTQCTLAERELNRFMGR